MKKILLIILIGVFIMLKPINAIINNSIANIIQRGSVVTGIIATDNGDGGYDVFISESEKAYPKIRTLSRNPDIAVGDKVRILYKDGCPELPIIYPPTTVTVAVAEHGIIYIYYYGSNNYLVILDADGNIMDSILLSTVSYTTDQDAEVVNNNGSIYVTGRFANRFKKLNSEGVTQVEVDVTLPFQIAINASGDIWLYEWTDDNYFVKRDPTTLAKTDEIALNNSQDYMGMAFGSDGFLYAVNWVSEEIEKWDVVGKVRLAHRTTGVGGASVYCSLAVIGSNIYMVNSGNRDADYWTMPTSLGSNFTLHQLAEFAANDDVEFITAIGGSHFVVEGIIRDNGNRIKHILKYTSGGVLVWDTPMIVTGTGLGVAAWPF